LSDLPDKDLSSASLDGDFSKPWYHGSPLRLEVLAAGSTITQAVELARVFSHKPQIVSLDEDTQPMRLRHNGIQPGFLYGVAEEINIADVVPHPRSSMAAGLEWLTCRPIHLRFLGPVEITPEEVLGDDELRRLLDQMKKG
jgi:hypothetical protein